MKFHKDFMKSYKHECLCTMQTEKKVIPLALQDFENVFRFMYDDNCLN